MTRALLLLASLHCSSVLAQAPVAQPAPVVAPAPVAVPSAPVMVTPQAVMQTGPISVVGTNETLWLAVISGVVGLMGTIFTGIITYLMARLNKNAANTTIVAKESLDRTNEAVKGISTVHALINHERHVLLDALAVQAQRIADITKLPADQDRANVASKALKDHDAGQAALDAMKLMEPGKLQ